jgi:membrane fusion protein, multidrug efflux system
MKKKVIFAAIGVLALILVLGGIKALQIQRMMEAGAQFMPPPETVTTAKVRSETWEPRLQAVGSLAAVQGVTVSAEQTGKVTRIAFAPGAKVRAGEVLIVQDTSSESARLPGAQAGAALAQSNLERAERLLAEKIISPAEYDAAVATARQARAEVENIQADVGKKTVRAPFAGRLGIRLVNLGQTLREGDPIVSLQALDPIFVNFQLPQQFLQQLQPGLPVRVSADSLPGEFIDGQITAINPEVDAATRNIRVQATVDNPREYLRPGMFVNVEVVLPEQQPVLTIPATAVLYAPYSDTVFVVEESPAQGEERGLVLRQQVVRLGEKRGDYIVVSEGLQEGEMVVTTGVFKLRNGQAVVIDNTLSPEFKLRPTPGNE